MVNVPNHGKTGWCSQLRNLDQREIRCAINGNCVFGTERQLVKAKSMTNMSSPTSTGGLPCTDNTKRREKKNTENANIRNIAEKISDRKKVLLTAFRDNSFILIYRP